MRLGFAVLHEFRGLQLSNIYIDTLLLQTDFSILLGTSRIHILIRVKFVAEVDLNGIFGCGGVV